MTQFVGNVGSIGGYLGPGGVSGTNPTTGTPGGAVGAAQTQDPSIAGTGTFHAVPYPINQSAITNSSQLNNVWGNLQTALGGLQPRSYQTSAAQLGGAPQFSAALGRAPTGTAAQGVGATGTAAQGAAATGSAPVGSPAWWQAVYGSGVPMGTAASGGYALGGPTGISTAGDLAWQAQQQGLANQLALTASGGGVSPADLQLRQGAEQGIAQQLSVLGSQRGNMGNAALTARAAADQGAAGEAELNAQMGIQRAQETLAAQQALGGVLGTARGQAQNYNINQAGLTQQMSLADLANAQAAQMQNAGFQQQTGLANLGNAQQLGLANLGYANAAAQGNAQLGQQAMLANLGLAGQYGLNNVNNAQAMTLANMGAANQFGLANLGNAQQAMLTNLNAQNQFGLANLGNAQQMGLANLGNVQQQNLANQAMLGQYGLTQAQLVQQANLANQQAAYQGQGQYYNQLNALLGASSGVAGQQMNANLAAQQLAVQQQIAANQVNAQAYAASAGNNANLFGAGLNAAGGLIGAGINALGGSASGSPIPSVAAGVNPADVQNGMAGGYYDENGNYVPSDRRVKTDIRSAGDTVHALLMAVSDENLKTGVMGGNPMLQSYLEQFRAARGKQENVDPTLGESFRLSRGPSGVVGGSAGTGLGRQIGSSVGGALGGAAAGAAAGSIVPGIGTAIGAVFGGLLGSQAGGALGSVADSPGSAGRVVGGGVQASGEVGNESLSDAPDYAQLSAIGGSDVDADPYKASSDDREKEAIMGGNRGIQAFLQQQNAQQGAQANQAGSNNTFMQTGQPPIPQMDRQMPYNPNAGYGAPQWMSTPMDVGYAQAGGVYGGGMNLSGGAYGIGGLTQGPTMSAGGLIQGTSLSPGGVTQGSTMTPGGISTMGGQTSGGPSSGAATTIQNPNFVPFAGASTPAANPLTQVIPRSGRPLVANAQPITSTGGSLGGSSPAANPGYIAQGPSYVQAPAPGYGTIAAPNITPPGTGLTQVPGVFGPGPAASPQTFVTNTPALRLSDEEQKQNVQPSHENLQQMLDALHAYSYRYKDPGQPGAAPGRQIGVMAQDLERSPLGSQFVIDTPHGKMVNYGQAAGTMMAGLAYHNERLDQHEAMLRALLGNGGAGGGPHPY